MRSEPIRIGSVIRHAIAFDWKRSREEWLGMDDLLSAVERLFARLEAARVEYLLVGGIALLQYVAGRNTQDVDLIVALDALERLPDLEIQEKDVNFARATFEGLQVDALLTRNRLFRHVLRRHATVSHFAERAIPTATVEGLILLKLYALPSLYRQMNLTRVALYEADLAMLLVTYQPDTGALLAELAPFVSEADGAALREVVTDIQARLDRFGRGFGESEGGE